MPRRWTGEASKSDDPPFPVRGVVGGWVDAWDGPASDTLLLQRLAALYRDREDAEVARLREQAGVDAGGGA